MKEAKCSDCGVLFELSGENIPKGMKCFCNSIKFEIIDVVMA